MAEQWQVISRSANYKRTYTNVKAAKVDYGEWCNGMEESLEGSVELYYREDLNEDWTLLEECSYEEEEEEEEEEEQEDDNDEH